MCLSLSGPWEETACEEASVDTNYAADLAALLPVGGAFVKTDVSVIAAEIQESLASVPTLGSPVAFPVEELPLTHREGKCIQQGLPITRYRVEKMGD